MSGPGRCTVCGSAVPADAPRGQCPECLMRIGLDTTDISEPGDRRSERIGPYRLLQKLGEGGMGEVWLAEQSEPVKRHVALKIIKQGMDTKQVVARFEAERQALAMMDHPAVAKVFDAGTTSRGRPYFVMEYVKGVPITEHCDRHRLNNRERLELFREVCEGVQHAHQKAIIHRDLKPTNVLVTEQGGKRLPKIIDFGVAKATAQKLTEKTLFTELGVLIGTPEYMSPEQAELTGEDVDTRTDVYSLGVMLYELLVGALPFDPKELRSGGFEGIRKKIREEQPPKPSTRLSTLGDRSTESASCRRVDLTTLRRQLRGDLDWIAMRALEKDRSRRYASPMELAADIERHLGHEPVLASPPSATYRARRFVRRHRLGVSLAVTGVVVLLAFTGTMAVQARLIAAERDRANAEAERASREAKAKGQVSEFLKNLFSVSDPGEARGNSITARELLDKGAEEIEALEDEEIRAELMQTMGDVYRKLGLFRQALSLFERALAERKRILGDDHPDTLQSVTSVAGLYQGPMHRHDEAEALHLQTIETKKRVLGEDDPSTLYSMLLLAGMYVDQNRFSEAEPLQLEVVDAWTRVGGADAAATLSAVNNLAVLYLRQGRYDEAEPLFLRLIEAQTRANGEDHPETLLYKSNLAAIYRRQGRYDEAESLYLETLEAQKRVLGVDNPGTAMSLSGLAHLYRDQNRYSEAETFLLEALAVRKRVLGDDHPKTLASIESLAELYRLQGRNAEADALTRQSAETR